MMMLPDDPLAAHARFMAALCDDFASPEFLRTGKTPRANAVVAVRNSTSPREDGAQLNKRPR